MIVDAHHHFWDPDRGHYPWMVGPMAKIRRPFGPDDLAPELRNCGVAVTVLVQTWSSLDETWDFLQIAAETKFVAGVVGWVDLTRSDVGSTINELRSSPNGRYLVGLRHQVHDEPDPRWLLRSDVDRGISAVGDAGLIYDLLVRPRELPAALDLVRKHPDTTFVIDHIGKPNIAQREVSEWAQALAPFAALPNVQCKLSGMVTEANWESWQPDDLKPYVDLVIEFFGTSRVMYGSDWPVCLIAGSYRRVFDALGYCIRDLSQTERDGIFGGTATATYALVSPE